VWRDWALVAAVVVSTVVEILARSDIVWLPLATAMALLLPLALLYRRTHPFAASAAFAAAVVMNLVVLATGTTGFGLYTMAFILILPYSLLRWGSGPEIAMGAVLMVGMLLTGLLADPTTPSESIAAAVFFFIPAELGGLVRYWTRARVREIEDVRVREREQLARELHDAVAHHVSAIAIRAQAGQAIATHAPHEAIDALAVIEREASNTLAEMRMMVGVLRQEGTAALEPQPGVGDIGRLARRDGDPPRVEVTISGHLDDVGTSVGSAAYRIAQESVTNALRHAANATTVSVTVSGDDDLVHLRVEDDGDPVTSHRHGTGYGIRGMAERAGLLGGNLSAGPSGARGWVVEAILPRQVR
jgi:signal transduction histidine kinase